MDRKFMPEREGGYSLVELMVALFVAAIVLGGMYQGFNTIHRWWVDAGARSDASQNLRAGLETVTRDLEMTGYQATNYGDAKKAGLAVTLAEEHRIEVDQQRLDIATGTYVPQIVYYHLRSNNLYRQLRSEPGVAAPDELVAENISGFDLAYFGVSTTDSSDKHNDYPLSASLPASYVRDVDPPAVLKSIRRIQVTLTAAPTDHLWGTKGTPTKSFSLTASIMPQNLIASESTGDTTPPVQVAGVEVADTGSCSNKLQVKWTKNTEQDVAGYRVFYGATSQVRYPVSALGAGTTAVTLLKPNDLAITKYADRADATKANTYPIEVLAYDSSGNEGPKSDVLTGNPNPDIRTPGATADTTVNPDIPSTPTDMSVTAPAGSSGQLVISWSAPADDSATVGFRLYRFQSTTGFTSGAHIDDSLQIADESVLTAATTSFTDTGADLTGKALSGCVTYHYAVASVNCDETLVSTYIYDKDNLGDKTKNNYAVMNGAPLDATPPPAPSLVDSRGGWKRVYVNLTNPTAEESTDFLYTKVFWNQSDAASWVVDNTVRPCAVSFGGAAATTIPDKDNALWGAGTFTKRGSQIAVFDHPTLETPPGGTPSLNNDVSYQLLAVSQDLCGNCASGPPSMASPKLCKDDPIGAPPEAPTSPTYTSCDPTSVQLGWAYLPEDYTAESGASQRVWDLAGYRIERSGPTAVLTEGIDLTGGPTGKSWMDADSLQAGGTYTYNIRATDCCYEKGDPACSSNRSTALTIGPVTPGQLIKYEPDPATTTPLAAENFVTTISDSTSETSHPHTYHNNVKFYLSNTSAGTMTIKKMAVSWDNPSIVLDSVTIGSENTDVKTKSEGPINAGRVTSGVPFSVNKQILDLAKDVGVPSGPVRVLLRFTTPDGSVNRLVDLRSETLNISLWVQNDSLQTSDCTAPDEILIEVPRGPLLGGFSQDAPGEYGIPAYPVVGEGSARDTDLVVPGGTLVNVFGTVFDNSRDISLSGENLGFDADKLMLIGTKANPETDLLNPPQMPAITFPVATPDFELPLKNLGGDRYAISKALGDGAKMPLASNMVNWYYVLGEDKTGNWDRQPNPDLGNYAYFQEVTPDCAIPKAIANLAISAVARTTPSGLDKATFTWSAVTQYTNGTTIPSGEVVYDVYSNDTGVPEFTTKVCADVVGTSCVQNADLGSTINYYVAVAKTTCEPQKVSAISNVVRECLGASSVYCQTFRVPSSTNYYQPVTISINDVCMHANNTATNKMVFRIKKDTSTKIADFVVTETTATSGNFTKDFTFYDYGTTSGTKIVDTASPAYFDLLNVNAAGNGAGTTVYCSDKPLELIGDACGKSPGRPDPVHAKAAGSKSATVTWRAPTGDTDIAGYEIGYKYRTCKDVRRGECRQWNDNWTDYPAEGSGTFVAAPAETQTFTGLTVGSKNIAQYRFRVRTKDLCPTPKYSDWEDSQKVVIRN